MPELTWTALRGMNSSDPPARLGPSWATSILNVLLEPLSLGRRRPTLTAITLTSGPTVSTRFLYRHQPSGITKFGSGGAELWAFCGDTSGATLARRANGTWSTPTASDSPTNWASDLPHAVTFNGKLFMAYNTTVNRLHLWDGSSVRRVGIAASAAATVANTGSGSYTATLRYYKIQWKILSGSDTVATSELSASVSFTPSGSGTAARVTKPTTPDSATHWVVFGSADNVTYYNVSGDTAVGTTTYDDSAEPNTYSSGTVAPTAGLYVPPPSAKYLLSANNRLFMAGAWESSGASTETAPYQSRVWFTQVLGALDDTGEDEAIAQTTAYKDWIDVGEEDGDAITGLAGAVDGSIFVFKDRSIYRLSPTGDVNTPYRADQVTRSVGAVWQGGICSGEDGQGNPAIYFQSVQGPMRIVSGFGVERMGEDIRVRTGLVQSPFSTGKVTAVWDPSLQVVWWLGFDQNTCFGFQPRFESRGADGVRGGWTKHVFSPGASSDTNQAACIYERDSDGTPTLYYASATYSGGSPTTTYLGAMTSTTAIADVSNSLAAAVISPIFQPAGPLRRVRFQNAILEFDYASVATQHAVSISSAIGGPTAVIGTVSDTAANSTYTTSVVQEKLEAIQLSDVSGFQATVTWSSATGGVPPRITSLTIPYEEQEPT